MRSRAARNIGSPLAGARPRDPADPGCSADSPRHVACMCLRAWSAEGVAHGCLLRPRAPRYAARGGWSEFVDEPSPRLVVAGVGTEERFRSGPALRCGTRRRGFARSSRARRRRWCASRRCRSGSPASRPARSRVRCGSCPAWRRRWRPGCRSDASVGADGGERRVDERGGRSRPRPDGAGGRSSTPTRKAAHVPVVGVQDDVLARDHVVGRERERHAAGRRVAASAEITRCESVCDDLPDEVVDRVQVAPRFAAGSSAASITLRWMPFEKKSRPPISTITLVRDPRAGVTVGLV